ncbi:uncharacterized protein K452DRAFT_321932 [Aplosporella prunicola CBS 121167]|uniref:PHD-type domain-containing protein n=1 Tax=Aplosporella prunicola CBS 121167 TaxID=1176127 RepID=A0A6A6B0Z5_9PEZI|nr:uncharacterized protein K452DRAFT_321932 [Aplosporella prunicola CBS 121167]KAF2137238.1 hypothetical protein K452DRAFT_321932 [Aplosporella prunicola CBS 121167]
MDSDSDTESLNAPTEQTERPPTRPWDFHLVKVVPSPVENRDEYEIWGNRVRKVLREMDESDGLYYRVVFEDAHIETISFGKLIDLDNGKAAVQRFHEHPESSEDELNAANMKLKLTLNEPDDDSDDYGTSQTRTRMRRAKRGLLFTRSRNSPVEVSSGEDEDEDQGSDESSPTLSLRRSTRNTRSTRTKPRQTRTSLRQVDLSDEDEDEPSGSSDDGVFRLRSDVLPSTRKRKRTDRFGTESSSKSARLGTRRSDRATRHQMNMEEGALDEEVFRDEPDKRPAAPKAVGIREVFKDLPRSDPFRQRHIQQCDTCGEGVTIGPLVYCQGCPLAYHKGCLGHRNGREHLVTKVGVDEFVLQCRRCINVPRRKDSLAPDHAQCQVCSKSGSSCHPLRARKTALQEQKEREDNLGEDPITKVSPDLINNPHNVMFRCVSCWRAFHFHHLPPKSAHHMDIEEDDEETAERRFTEYTRNWKCKECSEMPAKVSGIVAWKPTDEENYQAGLACEQIEEDEKAYLIKWEKLSYFRSTWMPGAWTWGVTAPAMRKAFNKRESSPKMRTEDAIPEEYLRIDIVLDVKYTSIVDIRTEEIDKARIKEVDEALIKYKGLGYEDAVWEKVPIPEDGDRWTDFVTAYNDWVLGRYVHAPKKGPLQARLEKARSHPFTKLEKQKQPENLQAGMKLMKYQLDGLNWLYYQWYSKKNGILADEMGLGKTIQVISFLATLIQDHNCFPFLIVVPNSTCPNWRREIKQWAPSLRVVTYFGSSAARSMAYQYELFPEASKDLRCHVVVTSYEAAADDNCRKFFRSINWAGLIIDEGQRLKSDKSFLYRSLNALKVPFRVLLTGTPLQNNARELFNLLQFLDDSIDAANLEEEYTEMTKEKIMKLHDLIRPYILRRTKAQVLTFLPPMAQIILPISMSVLQKKLYKSILQKNPELLKALFSTNHSLKPQERASLSNILMQLRKCLCHPFVYSREIEERTDVAAISHRNLVEASAKLQLLEMLLPKLKERGHRVLIFSQFLDMLDIIEDFLDGLEMGYRRLDGSIGSLEKQKRIDEFNAPDSPLFAFILSTRAGGVGINLATADTVIIMDPDFNPHQDIQALSRAHRIGQKNKVLCFQLMTRSSAEEKIFQIGRKKMALDHVVVESLDADDLEERDVESILRHGAAELFSEDSGDQDIKYDNASTEKLLDRSQIENTRTGEDATAETQFSFARVWANDQGALEGLLEINDDEEERIPDPSVWDKILQEREKAAAAEAAARQQALGRGKRARMLVDYNVNDREAGLDVEEADNVAPGKNRGRHRKKDDSDTDFQAEGSEDEESIPDVGEAQVDVTELAEAPPQKDRGIAAAHVPKPPKPAGPKVKGFSRARSPPSPPHFPSHMPLPPGYVRTCPACRKTHAVGACPLKIAGPEHCNLCGLAHFGIARVCPHIGSETQVREMIAALKQSSEPRHLVETALKYLRGVKGHLVQKKKQAIENSKKGTSVLAPVPSNVVLSSTGHATAAGGSGGGGHGASSAGAQPGASGSVAQNGSGHGGRDTTANNTPAPAHEHHDEAAVAAALQSYLRNPGGG